MTNSYTTGPNLFRKFLLAGVTLALSVLFSVSSWGQVATYNYSASAGTYTEITGGTVVSTTSWDSNNSALITINSFTYNATAVTAMTINSNGWIAIGGTSAAASASQSTPMSSATTAAGAAGVICAFGADLWANGVGEVRWEYLAGSNETVIQWKNWQTYTFGGNGSNLNFQIRLNHANNSIAMVYGTMTRGTGTNNPQVGIKNGVAAGTIGTTQLGLTLQNQPAGTTCLNWSNAVRSSVNNQSMLFTSAAPVSTLSSGTTFTFTPQTGLVGTWVNPVTTFTVNTGWTITTSGATVGWTAPTNANRYNVQYRNVNDCSWTNFSGNPVSAASATLTGLTSATTYQVRVQPFNVTSGNTAGYSHITLGNATANSNGYVLAGSFTTLANPATVTGYTVAGVASNPMCSNGGQTLVITGTSFTAGSSVSIGGAAAIGVVVNSLTQITCTTPAALALGTGFITVTNSSASPSATGAANAFTVQARPVVAFSPSASVAPCGSYPLTVTASNTATATATTWSWSNAATLSAATGASVDVLTTTNQSYVATATDAYGCTNTATLTATPSTPAAVTVTPSVPYYCGNGSTVNVTASSSDLDYAYTFSVVDFGTISNVTASTCDFAVTQTSALKTRAVDAILGCATDVYTSIGVYPFPSPAMTATPSTVCEGSTSVLASGLSAGNFSVASITHNWRTAPTTATTLATNGQAVVAQSGGSLDDGGWAGIPIGFNYNFFGTTFTTIAAGTNGLLMFGTVPGYTTAAGNLGQYNFNSNPTACTPAGVNGTVFPNCNNPGNVIALMAADQYFGSGTAASASSTMKYWTEGYAPNRIFVIQYSDVDACCSNNATGFSAQCQLFETTGIVEIHIQYKSNTGAATVGLQDATKTIGAVAPGRQGFTTTIATPEGWRFSPPSNYTTAWSPSGSFTAPTTGTNIFGKTTNALTTVGTNTFNLTVTDQTTGCSNSASPASVNVTVLAIPSVPATADVTAYGSILGATSATQSPLSFCGPQTATVNYNATLTAPEVLRWYDAATGGNLLATATSYTTGSLSASDTVYLEIYNGVCTSPSRFPFILSYNAPPAITINSLGPDNDINCGVGPTYSMTYSATSSNDPNYTYTWSTDSIATSFTVSGNSVTLSSIASTVTHLAAFDSTSGCAIGFDKSLAIFDFPTIVPTSTDSIICIGDSTTVSSGVEVANFSVACHAHNWKTPPAGTANRLVLNGVTDVALTSGSLDDGGWGGIPIGFTFDFFGVDYTTLNVGTNGVVQFGTYNSSGLGDYTFTGFPSTTEPLGVIAVCATDLYMSTSGRVRYWTEGVTPSRVFVLEYNNVPGWTTDGQYSVQLHLFETTGIFQIHAKQATGTGSKTIGVNSPDGLIGATAPVCNIAPVGSVRWNSNSSTIVSAFPWSWQFNPPVDYTFAWSPSGEISGATNTASVVAYPTATAAGTQTYGLTVTDNVSGCVGTPVTYPVQIIDIPVAPNVVSYGTYSNVDGTNGTTFCGPQGVKWYCSDSLPSGWNVVYYLTQNGTGYPFAATDTINKTVGGIPVVHSANDTIWATLSNGSCEGPMTQVVFTYQAADTIAISNSSPINCGPSNVTYTSTLVASSNAPYTYTWNASPYLDTTVGATVTAGINSTAVFTVNGEDGYCFNTASTAVSRYNFPTILPTTQYDSVCPGGTSVIYSNATLGAFSVIAKGYSPESDAGYTPTFLCSNGGQDVPLSQGTLDDGGWFNVPLGFDFEFLGTTYNSCHVSTNGNIQFGNTSLFSQSFSAVTIPATATPNNFIALFWGDLDFRSNSGEGSSIRYWTSNIAPNRVFNIQFDGVRYGQALTSRYTGTIALNEATGFIELDIQQVTHGGASNTVMGAENISGTIGGSPTGRSYGTWQITTPEGWVLNPPKDYSFSWLPAGEIDGSTTADTAVASPSVTTQYQLVVTDNQTTCDNSVTNQTYVTVGVASAAPVAGFTISDNTPTTGGILQTVILTNTTTELGGETYLWNFSPNTVSYVDGTSALSRNPHVQFLAPGFYSISMQVTSCTGTGATSLPNSINATAVYCYPNFTIGCNSGDAIEDVQIFNPAGSLIMSHLASGCTANTGGYEAYAPVAGTTSCTFYQGSTYSIQVSTNYADYYGAWLDVNNDGDFNDPLEFLGASATATTLANFTLGIPSSNVVYGAHKLRIMSVDNGAPLVAGNSCISSSFGECQDYTVFIQAPVILNDIPTFAVNVQNSSNLTYPTCYAFTGNTSLATNSPETAPITGGDVWYKFTAQSTAVSIKVSSTSMDDIIALYSRDASGAYILIDSENAGTGASDYEQLNVSGLTAGTQYWIAVGSNSGGGAFSICIQNLMRSGCSTAIPVAGFGLCSTYQAVYRGAPSQGVTYSFKFTPTGATAGTINTLSGTNGSIALSNSTLALRYGGVYDVQVDVLYALTNSAGTAEPITVLGTSSDARCTGVTIRNHPMMEVRSNQRCNATLLRSSYLVGVVAAGSYASYICGATGFTYEMTPVVSCADGTTLGIAVEYNTSSASPYLPLGVLGNLPNAGAWDVRIRPNFSYGPGTYGATYRILVNNTAASAELAEGDVDVTEKVESFVAANLYPNPNNGEMVNLNVSGIESDNVFVRITDAMGRVVYTNRYTVDGSLNTIVTFAEPLASGLYNVEFTVDGEIMTERMIVAKQ